MVNEELEFLVGDYGFQRTGDASTEVLLGTKVSLAPSRSPRDGYETDVRYPRSGDSRFALGTLLAALDVPDSHRAAAHATFLRSHIEKLSDAPPQVRDDLFALRFWHSARWRKEWGHGIAMDANAIEAERARLVRLCNYFGIGSESAHAQPVA